MIERALMMAQPKPWGVLDSDPSLKGTRPAVRIGEIWFEPPSNGSSAPPPDLLLKLLFTSQPLSIQVHPTDAYAKSIGLPNGKTEAWYILSAEPGAKVAVGLKTPVTDQELRDSILDGSIEQQIAWHEVLEGDAVFVPAGTIHAIGAGLVIAEIQQRSDATFRLFDHGRSRQLHVDHAVAVSALSPAEPTRAAQKITAERTILVANSYFVFERIELPPQTMWTLNAALETWVLLLAGDARIGSFEVRSGDAIYAQSDRVEIESRGEGVQALVAYAGAGGPLGALLEPLGKPVRMQRDWLASLSEAAPSTSPTSINPGVRL